MSDDRALDAIHELAADRVLAHQVLFTHRHPDKTPPFHEDLIKRWHSPHRFSLFMAFRGGGKSTITEEATVVAAIFRDFQNCVILGESETRAVDRLRAIKHEFESNDMLRELFGDMMGPTWAETRIVLSNGVCIQAYGKGQSLRGVKHLDARPDLIVADDIEDEESVQTPAARDKMLKWWESVVMPARNPKNARVRFNATPLDEEALAVTLSNHADIDYKKYPIKYLNSEGEWTATWPTRFPLMFCDEEEARLTQVGKPDVWAREYMCEPVAEKNRTFSASMLTACSRVEPTLRSWHAVYAFYDPARTVKVTSAHTGFCAWSWVGRKLVIWESGGYHWKPDEIIADMFRLDERYTPVAIGVEEDGLHEFLMQPLRHAQVDRGHPLPLRPMKAPKGKHDFIRALQPFFKAGEIEIVGEQNELRNQLLSFPTGRIDVPNALAYALRMRPGAPVFDNFRSDHIAPTQRHPRETYWLACNVSPAVTTAALCQFVKGRLEVHADWLLEDDPGTVLADIVKAARLEAGAEPRNPLRLVAPPHCFAQYDTLGLRPAAAKIPAEVRKGGPEHIGREELRTLFATEVHGLPAVYVNPAASWTLRALSGGYARELDKHGLLGAHAANTPYKALIEGLESLAGLLSYAVDEKQDRRYAVTERGARYLTAKA